MNPVTWLLLPFRLLAIAGGIALIALIILPALALNKVVSDR